jgi:hypothetical protein
MPPRFMNLEDVRRVLTYEVANAEPEFLQTLWRLIENVSGQLVETDDGQAVLKIAADDRLWRRYRDITEGRDDA